MVVAALILGRYRLDREIAVGGTARVWRAHDVQLDRAVAVKLLHPHLLPDERSRLRLQAEARAAAALQHPGIATVYDVTGPEEEPALVMELVDGEPLSARLAREGAMPPEAAARLGVEVADALYHAHQRGIVHRDVKPANILVEAGSGRARLIDFGIAHSLELAAESLTRTGTTMGTPRYMAPEQLAGESIGPRTDLWGLGAVLHEALTGRPPFDGSTPLAIARQQVDGPPPADVDSALMGIVRACLAVPIAGRPLHAGAVATALGAWLHGDAAPALAMAAASQAAPETSAQTQLVAVQPPEPVVGEQDAPPPRRRIPRRAIAAALVLLLAVMAGAALAMNGGLPAVGQEASPTPQATPLATADWRAALLSVYSDACNGTLARSELRGLSQAEAEELVDERVQDCLDAADKPDKGKGGGRGNGRGGRGKD
jgi:serine/threonine-protein kinase